MTHPRDDLGRTAARRAAARAHHPDAGGSASAFIAALADIDARRSEPAVIVRATGGRRRAALRRWLRHRATRRYITL